MCMCKSPNVNGQLGYSWDGKDTGIRPPAPPELRDGDELVWDLPGRCGRGLDSHCHHFRVVKAYGSPSLLVRHGGGVERMPLGDRPLFEILGRLDPEDRYWTLQGIRNIWRKAQDDATREESARWTRAAAEKRIKVRWPRNHQKDTDDLAKRVLSGELDPEEAGRLAPRPRVDLMFGEDAVASFAVPR